MKASDNVGMVLMVLCAMDVLLVPVPEVDVAVVLTMMSLVILVVVEVLFVEKTKDILVSFELLAVLAGLAMRVKELIVMSGSGLKPGGQRMQAQERILVEEIFIEVVVFVNLSELLSDDREERLLEDNLSSCNMSSDDSSSGKLSFGSRLVKDMRLFICLRNSSTGSPSTGTGRVGLDLTKQN